MTVLPSFRAGRITSVINWAREAAKRSNSASGEIGLSRFRLRDFLISAPRIVPPGSCVIMAGIFRWRRFFHRALAWVLLPQPSPPSNVINSPNRLSRASCCNAIFLRSSGYGYQSQGCAAQLRDVANGGHRKSEKRQDKRYPDTVSFEQHHCS